MYKFISLLEAIPMYFESAFSVFQLCLFMLVIFIILAPIGSLLDALVKHISSGRLRLSLLVLNEIILFFIFASCIYFLDEWLDAVKLTTYAEFSFAFLIYSVSLLIEYIGEYVKMRDKNLKS